MADSPPSRSEPSSASVFALLRVFASHQRTAMLCYVALSLGGALAGSLAAVWLVPLVQPEQAGAFAAGLPRIGAGSDARIAIFLAAGLGFALMRWQAARLGARLVSACAMRLRSAVHARLMQASLKSLAETSSAEIANVLTYNVEIVVQGFSAWLQLLVASVTTAISLGFACWIAPYLMLWMPPLALLGLAVSRLSGREQSRISRRYVADMTRLFWHSEDVPRRLRHIRSFGRERVEQASYEAISRQLGHGYRRQLELVASGRLALETMAAVGAVAVFALARRWHALDASSLIAVSLLLGRLLPYLASSRQQFQQLRSAVPAFALWQRYMQLACEPAPADIAPVTQRDGLLSIGPLHLTPPPGGLDVDSLVLRPGELTVICGDSGIGKSSLVDVLAGMKAPERFAARLGERALSFAQYRALVRDGAYVSQQVRPWQASLRECLAWAAPAADEAQVRAALADVGLDQCLAGSSGAAGMSLEHAVSQLSGGELQRLLLAQVILKQPFLAVLDEATGALDAASEVTVLRALKRRLPHSIVLVVSHRPGVMAIADQLLTIAPGDADGPARASVAAGKMRPAQEHIGRPLRVGESG